MKRILRRLVIAGLGLAFVATPVFAQGGLILGGGLSLPQGDYKDAVKSGYHGMAGLNFAVLGAPLGVRVDAAYHLNDFDLPGSPDAASALLAVSGSAVYTFPSVGAKPYLVGGITWARAKCSGDDCVSDASDSDTGFNVGGGIRFGSIFAEARYLSIGGDVDLKLVPITVGFTF
jgi:opacity protein-like surface antigen